MLRRFSGKLKLYRRYGRRCLDVRQKSAEPESAEPESAEAEQAEPKPESEPAGAAEPEPALTARYTGQSMGESVQGHSPPWGFTGA